MKANELRIGNLVLDQHKEEHIISANCFQRFRYPTMDNDYGFYPIPITEEWLLKCGFVIVNHINGYSFHTMDRKRNKDKHKPAIDIYENKTLYMGHHINHCQHVHQLQNLYFALTGEELEI